MSRSSWGRLGWLLSALVAAVATPLFGATSWVAGAAAGASVLLAGAAITLLAARQVIPAAPRRSIAAALLLSAIAVAAGLIALIPTWIPALLGLVAGVVITTGIAAWIETGAQQREEAEVLRARLVRREGDVRAQAEKIRRLDLRDPVTGLLNQRGFASGLAVALAECTNEGAPLALLLIELPGPLPQQPGAEGAHRAARIGSAIQQSVRGSDIAGRWDDRILALLLPRCADTEPALSRLRTRLAYEADSSWVWAGITVSGDGPWPDAEGLVTATQAALARTRGARQIDPSRNDDVFVPLPRSASVQPV